MEFNKNISKILKKITIITNSLINEFWKIDEDSHFEFGLIYYIGLAYYFTNYDHQDNTELDISFDNFLKNNIILDISKLDNLINKSEIDLLLFKIDDTINCYQYLVKNDENIQKDVYFNKLSNKAINILNSVKNKII